jgi:hypothetical protein
LSKTCLSLPKSENRDEKIASTLSATADCLNSSAGTAVESE